MIKVLGLLVKTVIAVVVLCLVYALGFYFWVDTSRYNYTHFSANQFEFGQFVGPAAGQALYDFTVTDANGNERSLSEYRGRYVVIETGSMTCPQYVSRVEPMNQLADQFPDVEFVVLYVREAHPGSNIAAHTTFADKSLLANQLRSQESENRLVWVDSLQGEIHQALGSWPNMVYVIDPQGEVAFRGMWNNPPVIAEVLQRLKRGESLEGLQTGMPVSSPETVRRVLVRAGGHAIVDMAVGMLPAALGHAYENIAGAGE